MPAAALRLAAAAERRCCMQSGVGQEGAAQREKERERERENSREGINIV